LYQSGRNLAITKNSLKKLNLQYVSSPIYKSVALSSTKSLWKNHEHGIWGELIGKNLTGKD